MILVITGPAGTRMWMRPASARKLSVMSLGSGTPMVGPCAQAACFQLVR